MALHHRSFSTHSLEVRAFWEGEQYTPTHALFTLLYALSSFPELKALPSPVG